MERKTKFLFGTIILFFVLLLILSKASFGYISRIFDLIRFLLCWGIGVLIIFILFEQIKDKKFVIISTLAGGLVGLSYSLGYYAHLIKCPYPSEHGYFFCGIMAILLPIVIAVLGAIIGITMNNIWKILKIAYKKRK